MQSATKNNNKKMTNKEKTTLQNSIINSLPENPHGRLILAPRIGKSRIVIEVIKKNKPNSILWVTPFADLMEKAIPEEFAKWGAKRYLPKLKTTTWASLNKIEGHYDTIIFDEEQFITVNNIQNFALGKITYNNIISMTGTKTDHFHKNELYERFNLEVLYDISINDAVDIGILNDYTINVIEVEMSRERNMEVGKKDHKFKTSELNNYTYLSERVIATGYSKFSILNRLRAIKNSPSKDRVAKFLVDNLKGRTLVFAPTIKQAESLSDHTYHSKTDDTDYEKFKNEEIEILAMVNSGGVGHTYSGVENVIIVQADSNKNGQTGQKIARALFLEEDKHPIIYILMLKGTQDETYVENTLNSFDEAKVNYFTEETIKDYIESL